MGSVLTLMVSAMVSVLLSLYVGNGVGAAEKGPVDFAQCYLELSKVSFLNFG